MESGKPRLSPSRAAAAEFLKNLCFFAAACLLFALSHPNPIFPRGIFAAGWFAYIPVFILLSRIRLRWAALWGAVYGALAYNLQGYWLTVFHPLAGIIVGAIALFWFSILFFLIKSALDLAPPSLSPLAATLLWTGFEYLRTLGFAAYPYGLIAYSQWEALPLIQIAGITGLWGVSALVLYPQAVIACFWGKPRTAAFGAQTNNPPAKHKLLWQLLPYCAALIAALVYGILLPADFDKERQVKLSLVQPNGDPWKDSLIEYRDNLRVLRRLSDAALAAPPADTDLVVWSETAFVPRIYWHSHYREDPDYYALVRELLDYMAEKDTPFLIGNDDARLEMSPSGEYERVDYNAVMLFDGANLVTQYRKIHLVPFTEYFPYKKQFPAIYQWLLSADTHFWQPGVERTVFDFNGLKFSTPICFEDSFSQLSREFTQNGAEFIINLSNDAWSGSLAGQYQHLSMAVFRTVENRRAMARATASGQTCAVLPNGKVTAEAPPFKESFINVTLPVMTSATVYTRFGDWLPVLCLALGGGSIVFFLIKKMLGN